MITEVFKNGKVIGFVIGKDRLAVRHTVLRAFPQVDRTATCYYLPKHDSRLKKIAENVYTWA